MKIIFLNEDLKQKVPESNTGNVEYKRKITEANAFTLEKRATQMLYRCVEGCGIATHYIGVADTGICSGISIHDLMCSIKNIQIIAHKVKIYLLQIIIYKGQNPGKYIAQLELRKTNNYNSEACLFSI